MINKNNLRILPLLIFVAMLAFSVRIADMAIGFSSLSGSAIAEDKASSEPPAELTGSKSIQEQIADRKAGNVADDTHAADSEDHTEKVPESVMIDEPAKGMHVSEVGNVDVPEMEWRDASDQEVDYANVKMEMFDDLSERRKLLDAREKEMMTREALLRAAEQELDRKYQELSGLRTEIINLLEKQSDEEKGRIASLVKIYEGMKPKDAARIFDTLDIDVLVAVMSEMSERKLSPVLAAMNPERARTITIMLAEQKQLPQLPYGE